MTGSPKFLAPVLAAVLLLPACAAGPPVAPTETAGSGDRDIQVLVEQAALDAIGSDIRQFVATRSITVGWGGGTAEAIATTVKQGYRVSVVVLPSGPAVERVRDELVAPPVRLGRRGGVTYWACPVDQYGLSFLRFLTSRRSVRVLRAHGFDFST